MLKNSEENGRNKQLGSEPLGSVVYIKLVGDILITFYNRFPYLLYFFLLYRNYLLNTDNENKQNLNFK